MKAEGPLNSYLLDVRARLNKARRETDESSQNHIKTTLVLGNEAADLDSIVSSLTYALLLNHQNPESFFVPVINIPRADLPLRPEVLHVLTECCVPHSSLIFIDDEELRNHETFVDAVILVDHNRLAAEQQKAFCDKVVGILDHHADEGEYQNVKPRIIETVGSATSLVALEWKKFCGSTEPPNSMPTQVAYILLAPILLDTVNLALALGRTYPKDMEAFSFLIEAVPPNAKFVANSYYNSICAARSDITPMCDRDLLRKDYKEWTIGDANARKDLPVDGQKPMPDEHRVGISSVGWSLDHWAESSARQKKPANGEASEQLFRPGDLSPIADSMIDFFAERNLTLLIVMLAMDRGAPEGFVRELAIYYPADGPDYGGLIHSLETDVGDLNLSRIGGESMQRADLDSNSVPPASVENAETGRVRFYKQGNIRVSRKVLWPMVRQMLEVGKSHL